MHEELDKHYVLRMEFEDLKEYSVRTRSMARNISQDLKDLANKIENDIDDDSFELNISRGRLRFGSLDLYKLIIAGSLLMIGLCLYVLAKYWRQPMRKREFLYFEIKNITSGNSCISVLDL